MASAGTDRIKLDDSWKSALADEFSSDYMVELRQFLLAEKAAGKSIYPKGGAWFAALDSCPLDQVRVVLLGQVFTIKSSWKRCNY